MNKPIRSGGLDRRTFFAGSGALIVTVVGCGVSSQRTFADASTTRPPRTPDQLDSWLSLDKSGGVTAYFGKIDVGQGIEVSVSQIIAEELDISLDRIRIVMGNSSARSALVSRG